jgi:hypothetical protein
LLRVRFRRVRPDRVERLRSWLKELGDRSDETKESMTKEGVRHEMAWLLHDANGPVLVYAIEAQDTEHARRVFKSSTLAIDVQHRDVLASCLTEDGSAELLLDIQDDAVDGTPPAK